jgi:hypothetical protein
VSYLTRAGLEVSAKERNTKIEKKWIIILPETKDKNIPTPSTLQNQINYRNPYKQTSPLWQQTLYSQIKILATAQMKNH